MITTNANMNRFVRMLTELPRELTREVVETIPLMNVEWPEISSCGYFVRTLSPFTLAQVRSDESAFRAFRRSVLRSLLIFRERVQNLVGGYLLGLRFRPKSDMKVVDMKAIDKAIVSAENKKFGDDPEELLALCKMIPQWKAYLKELPNKYRLYLDALRDFTQSSSLREFDITMRRHGISYTEWRDRVDTNTDNWVAVISSAEAILDYDIDEELSLIRFAVAPINPYDPAPLFIEKEDTWHAQVFWDSKRFNLEDRTLTFVVKPSARTVYRNPQRKPQEAEAMYLPRFVEMYREHIPLYLMDIHAPWRLTQVERAVNGIQITLQTESPTESPAPVDDTWLQNLADLFDEEDGYGDLAVPVVFPVQIKW